MKNQKTIFCFVLSLVFASGIFANFALAQELPPRTQDCENLYQWFTIKLRNGETNAIEDLPTICTAQSAISWIINTLLLLSGGVAVIFIIIGGFRYLTSAGNEEASEKAKKTLVTSIIGLIAIVLAATIVRIVATTLGTGKSGSGNSAGSTQR